MKVAIMGYGTIGSGVAEILNVNKDVIAKRAGEPVEVKYILDLRDFPGDPMENAIVHDYQTIVNDPEVGVVVETMGGVEPAYTFVKAMLEAGKQVTTSNKNLVAAKGAELIEIARDFNELGFKIIATGATCDMIRKDGIEAEKVCKINEGRPNVLDVISNGKIDLIINTPVGKKGAEDDSFIRKAAIKNRVPYMTTMAAARATAEGIKAVKNGEVLPVKSLQEFHADIR